MRCWSENSKCKISNFRPKFIALSTWKTSIKQMPFEVHTHYIYTTHKLTRSVSHRKDSYTHKRKEIYTKLTDKAEISEITFITNGPFEATEIISTINLLLLYLTKELRLRNFSPNYKNLIY